MKQRILIVEDQSKQRDLLRSFVVKGFPEYSVQVKAATLECVLEDVDLNQFSAIVAGCDFGIDGTRNNTTLTALRGHSANPNAAPVVLVANSGSEFTAVQAMNSGAFDYLPAARLDRTQLLAALERAVAHNHDHLSGDDGPVSVFGYDARQRLACTEAGSVHVAYSAEHSREVVLKIVNRRRGSLFTDREFERLVDEFRLLSDISDPATAEVYDFRATPQFCYIAMEYFPGGHIGHSIKAGLDPAQGLELIEEIAHALSIIHGAGIIHNDLKPGNVMRRDDGSVALIDFGISRRYRSDLDPDDEEEEVWGTPYYMSPEQAGGQPTSERSDIYSLGVICFEVLTGEKPFTGDSKAAIVEQHLTGSVPLLPEGLADYQPLIEQALAKDPNQRPASAREFVELISRIRELTHPGDSTTKQAVAAIL